MRNWRGRCFDKHGFAILGNVSKSNLVQIRTPLLCCEDVSLKTSEIACDDNRAYIPLCPLQESFKRPLFSMEDYVLKGTMTNGIIAQMTESTWRTVLNRGVPEKTDSIVSIVGESSKENVTKFKTEEKKKKSTISFKCFATTVYFWNELIAQMVCLRNLEYSRLKKRRINYRGSFQAVWEIRPGGNNQSSAAIIVRTVTRVSKVRFIISKETTFFKRELLVLRLKLFSKRLAPAQMSQASVHWYDLMWSWQTQLKFWQRFSHHQKQETKMKLKEQIYRALTCCWVVLTKVE